METAKMFKIFIEVKGTRYMSEGDRIERSDNEVIVKERFLKEFDGKLNEMEITIGDLRFKQIK